MIHEVNGRRQRANHLREAEVMAIIIACSCGERFDVPDSQAGKQHPCPACGQRLDIPSTPVFSLSSQKYLGPGTDWNPDDGVPTGEAFEKLPLCEKCHGSGVCPLCGGQSAHYDAWAWWEEIKKGLEVLFLAAHSQYAQRVTSLENQISTARCYDCNGNGKCYTCRGYGRMLGAEGP
jgi:hypothetical protein